MHRSDPSLENLGFTPFFEAVFAPHGDEGLRPARVTGESRDLYHLALAPGAPERLGELAGRLRHEAASREDLPAVGDWVAVAAPPAGPAVIHAVLPRRSRLARKEAGRGHDLQVVAANVDSVFLVTSLNRDLNARRVERTLALVWEGGASPVLVLSKTDLLPSPDALARYVLEMERVAPAVPAVALSAYTGEGLSGLTPYLERGRTVALLGSSGVGKSTLLNRLAGREVEATAGVRASDDRGRHTTTRRHLVSLPSGALLLDTPGLRELGLTGEEDAATVGRVFDDVASLAPSCRFRDCGHEREPGCAVREAVDPERLASYLKLSREAAWADLRQRTTAAHAEKRRWKELSARISRMGKRDG